MSNDDNRIVDSELVSETQGAPIHDGMRPNRRVGSRDDAPGTTTSGELDSVGHEHGLSADEDKFAERQVSALFILAAIGTVGFCVAYFTISIHDALGKYLNWGLGAGLAVSLLGIGAGMIMWAKKLIPHEVAVQDRHAFHSEPEDEFLAEETFLEGAAALQLRRPLLRRTLLGALGVLPIPAVILLRDLGPLPGKTLDHSGWKAGDRMVQPDTKLPVRLGDLDIGGIATVMPEGFTTTDDFPLAPTILIRFAPGEIKSAKEISWGIDDHVAYSKICTHAGCPISLYEQQTHHLLCPCHQSTFLMDEDAKVVFGPAARPLPQMQIEIDDEGFFVCKAPYDQPVGPSFWERS